MMSKKVYNDFARMVRKHRHLIIEGAKGMKEETSFFDGADKELSIVVDDLIELFQNDNPKFDKDRFYFACEIER